jgi:putative protease
LRPATEAQRQVTDIQLTVLCRSLDQLKTLLSIGQQDVIVDFADIRQYAEAAEWAHAAGVRIALATPRIHKPSETGVFRSMRRCEPDAVLVRNLAGVSYFVDQGTPVIADYSLNVSNELTARYLHELGVDRMTPSYDLNCDQLRDMVAVVPPAWLQVVIHQHVPMFHMEHCVFCAVLSPGTDKTNCGRPCDDHQVYLRDRVGMQHQLTADVGCRHTLFNAQPQSAAELVPALLSRGISSFRVELLDDEGTSDVRRIVDLYSQLIAGKISSQKVWRDLNAMNRVGVTRGTMEHQRDPLAII